MTIPGLFKEYIWLIETINRYGKISLAKLGELWKRRPEATGAEFSRTTFFRTVFYDRQPPQETVNKLILIVVH